MRKMLSWKNIKNEVFNKNEKILDFKENDKYLKNEEIIEKLELVKIQVLKKKEIKKQFQ